MTLAIYIKKKALREDPRILKLEEDLRSRGFELYALYDGEPLREGTDMVLSLGGDGTFLCAARLVGGSGVPVLGVNFGRLGFLSENKPEDVLEALSTGNYTIEERSVLEVGGEHALNEVAIHRQGGAMLGIEVKIDGRALPVYWADGMLVATSAGSTAYSLSVGGPICTPDARVLVLAPIAPHNLNIRPIVVPETSAVEISFRSREPEIMVTADNRNLVLPVSSRLSVSVAQFSLRRIRLDKSNFIQALKSKLFWGEDVRNL